MRGNISFFGAAFAMLLIVFFSGCLSVSENPSGELGGNFLGRGENFREGIPLREYIGRGEGNFSRNFTNGSMGWNQGDSANYCEGKVEGDNCAMVSSRGDAQGVCSFREGVLICLPEMAPLERDRERELGQRGPAGD
jgi:hypothetical protein